MIDLDMNSCRIVLKSRFFNLMSEIKIGQKKLSKLLNIQKIAIQTKWEEKGYIGNHS